jgi:CBS-domain-containing membrane protein
MLVQDAMTHETTTVTVDTPVKRATELLAQHHISTLPVLDAKGLLVGVVSEADLIKDAFPPDPRSHLRLGQSNDAITSKYVSEVMTAHVLSVYANTDLADAVELMTSTGIKCLPVIDDHGALVGVISRSDMIRVRAKADEIIERDVDSALISLGHSDWLVEVSDGIVEIEGPETDLDRTLARIGASTVAGVVTVKVR